MSFSKNRQWVWSDGTKTIRLHQEPTKEVFKELGNFLLTPPVCFLSSHCFPLY